ncbi:RHS repeat-associated core domain-containing protein [Thermogemmatispora carboxidivorans]|uniref:RHS repeat-associated core domain-containing protein n=1 Tax=Thermogemmatispora carboxidivorans TaxID=1382306 RepID=UPI00069B0DE2|nr:RHS repeat-associated core domain-containing protein [Thermogemmatispora carboxidivorans]
MPASWNVTTPLPTYQQQISYNDADQVTTTTASTSVAGDPGYSFTQVYDPDAGTLVGLSPTTGSSPLLASVTYNARALPDTVTIQTASGNAPAATEQFSYDADLRPVAVQALWGSGSGQSGSIFSQTRSYDAAGERVLRRSVTPGSTTLTVYAFGLEEHVYTGDGRLLSTTHYYDLGGQLLGELSGVGSQPGNTQLFLTDQGGSVVATFSNADGAAALVGNQGYGPYGSQRYRAGDMGTARGFTGQYGDDVSGLDYYGARYYDPQVGLFLSADPVQGNAQGLNPYAYVAGNPETFNDPTGLMYVCPGVGGCGGGGSSAVKEGGWLGSPLVVAVVSGVSQSGFRGRGVAVVARGKLQPRVWKPTTTMW